jgi:TonB family protein
MRSGPSDANRAETDATSPGPRGVHVWVESDHPDDVPFMFEAGRKRAPGALASSVLVHAAAAGIILLGLHFQAPATSQDNNTPVQKLPQGIVWLVTPGPGGGGGGGGNGMKAPPRRAELPGRDRLTLPAAKPKPVVIAPQVARPEPAVAQVPQLSIDALRTAQGTEMVVGTLDGVPGSVSQGPGTGGGAGTGNGNGVGPGTGPGLGPGSGGGEGGGPRGPGSGVEDPRPIYQPKPEYTAAAMQAKIQGVALVECVVLTDGTVGQPRIVRSLDGRFGLDDEAIKCARKWRFIPARRRGQPVAMLVNIEVTFSLR